jgi:hypothetical protein
MTLIVILNVGLAVAVVGTIVALLGYSILNDRPGNQDEAVERRRGDIPNPRHPRPVPPSRLRPSERPRTGSDHDHDREPVVA